MHISYTLIFINVINVTTVSIDVLTAINIEKNLIGATFSITTDTDFHRHPVITIFHHHFYVNKSHTRAERREKKIVKFIQEYLVTKETAFL